LKSDLYPGLDRQQKLVNSTYW